MSKVTSYFVEIFEQLREALTHFSSRVRPKEEYPLRECINQVNAIISNLPEEKCKLLPVALVEYFAEHADQPPSEAIDTSKPLDLKDLADDTIIFVFYIDMIFKEIKKSGAVTEEELHSAHVQASKEFVEMLSEGRPELLNN